MSPIKNLLKPFANKTPSFRNYLLKMVFITFILISAFGMSTSMMNRRSLMEANNQALAIIDAAVMDEDPNTDQAHEESLEIQQEERIYEDGNGLSNRGFEGIDEDENASLMKANQKIVDLKEINPEVVGWIKIENTEINYPLVQGGDNGYYLNRDWTRNRNPGGAIFMDYRNDSLMLDKGRSHTIIYGHHQRDGSMFQNLMKYKEEDFFRNNLTIKVSNLFEHHEYEIFSAYVTGTDFYYIETRFPSNNHFVRFIEGLVERSLFETEMAVSPDDDILTLSTCTYEFPDARFVVHARRVK